MAKSKSTPLSRVTVGDVFLMPLEDGRLGACRILRTNAEEDSVLVAATNWVGTEPPDLSEPQLRTILLKSHHAWKGAPCAHWVIQNAVPETFTHLGSILPTSEEEKLTGQFSTSWNYFPEQVFLQWRWDNEREQVLAEEEAEREQQRAEQEAQYRAYKPLPRVTLEELRRLPMPEWSGYYDPAGGRRGRRILRDTLDELIELGLEGPVPEKLDVIRQCIERLNILDDEDEDFDIDTMERERLCNWVDDVASLVALDDFGTILTDTRDW